MTKGEQALQLTLAMIQEKRYYINGEDNESIGKAVAEIYNAIINNIDYPRVQ